MEYVTIDRDRYGGAYSHARFTAWIGDAPYDVDAGDGSCEDFWAGEVPVHGRGDSALDALRDLTAKSGRWIGSFDIVDRGGGWTGGVTSRYLLVHTDAFKEWFGDLG